MRELDSKFIDCIMIPDIENGITKQNISYFVFPDSAYQLLGKRAMRILCVEVVLFVFWLGLRDQGSSVLFAVATVLLVILAVFYERDYRYVRYYKQAQKGASTLAADYTMKKIGKLVACRRVFVKDMPPVYYILKAKALLAQNDPVAADVLMDQMDASQTDQISYIKALCAYMLEEDDRAVRLLEQIDKGSKIDKALRNREKELWKLIQAPSSGENAL